MSGSKFTIGLYVVLVFLSGVVVGAFGHRLYTATSVRATSGPPRSPDEYRQKYVREMRDRLKLNQDQVAKLEAVLDATRSEFRYFRERHKDEYRAIQDGQVTKINNLLTPVQQTEYQKMREERDRHSRGKR